MINYMVNYMAIICLSKKHELPLMYHELSLIIKFELHVGDMLKRRKNLDK